MKIRTAAVLVLALALASGCKKDCDLEASDGAFTELVDDFTDEDVMGGEPMGCKVDACPSGTDCKHQMWAIFVGVSMPDAEKNITALLRKKGWSVIDGSRVAPPGEAVGFDVGKGSEKMRVAIGKVAESAEVIVAR